MHFCTGVVQRRNTQKNVFFGLPMVLLLTDRRVHQRTVAMQDRFGKTGCARAEINRRFIIISQRNAGVGARIADGLRDKIFCKGRAARAYVKQ